MRGCRGDLSRLVLPLSGSVEQTGNPFEPFRLEGVGGSAAAAGFFRELAACRRLDATVRSHGMDLLRWFRFLAAAVGWNDAPTAPRASTNTYAKPK